MLRIKQNIKERKCAKYGFGKSTRYACFYTPVSIILIYIKANPIKGVVPKYLKSSFFLAFRF